MPGPFGSSPSVRTDRPVPVPSNPNAWSRELVALLDLTKTLATGGSFRVACARALRRAVAEFGWRSASVIVFGPDGRGSSLAFGGANEDVVEARARASRARDGHAPLFATHGSHRLRSVSMPLVVGGHVVGALDVVWGTERDEIPSRQFPFIETLASHLAVWIDRTRLTEELEDRLVETRVTRRQLEAYATDVRETFAAEKQRAEQLADALGELELTYLATVKGLAIAVEAKDATTGGHLVRVAELGRELVRVLAPDMVGDRQLEFGFLLHDIGKLTVPDAILRKPGPLSEHEWEILRRHPADGRRILADIPFLAGARELVYGHHERWDGRGYPLGLRGEDIPFGARIFPVADALDAMISTRPYRPGMSIGAARAEVARCAGTQFWPEAVAALDAIPDHDLSRIMRMETEHGR